MTQFNSHITTSSEDLIGNAVLSRFFNFFSITFSASVLGLLLNIFINFNQPYTHVFFLFGIGVSLFSGIVINTLDKWIGQRIIRAQLNAFLKA